MGSSWQPVEKLSYKKRMKKSMSLVSVLSLMLSFPHGARGQQSTTLVNQDKIIARVQAMGDGASVDQVMSEAYKATGANYYERIQLIAKINTAPARQALLEVALGKGEGSAQSRQMLTFGYCETIGVPPICCLQRIGWFSFPHY